MDYIVRLQKEETPFVNVIIGGNFNENKVHFCVFCDRYPVFNMWATLSFFGGRRFGFLEKSIGVKYVKWAIFVINGEANVCHCVGLLPREIEFQV